MARPMAILQLCRHDKRVHNCTALRRRDREIRRYLRARRSLGHSALRTRTGYRWSNDNYSVQMLWYVFSYLLRWYRSLAARHDFVGELQTANLPVFFSHRKLLNLKLKLLKPVKHCYVEVWHLIQACRFIS